MPAMTARTRLYEFEGGQWGTACPICLVILDATSQKALEAKLVGHMNADHHKKESN